ncbi:serpin family protein [Singulisphaera sp. Ch08]|uniref:Serpin family protein n=1 Tax=Singulisphaera sp. Ch08 TaxID=3120278 RepID=A0AAU7CFY6_9BACT
MKNFLLYGNFVFILGCGTDVIERHQQILAINRIDDMRISECAQISTRFALRLYQSLPNSGQNVAFSPLGVMSVVGVLKTGARGDTAAQLSSVLHPDIPGIHLDDALAATVAYLADNSKDFTGTFDKVNKNDSMFSVSNAIWVPDGSQIRPEVESVLKTKYFCNLFDNKAGKSKHFNEWVNANTSRKRVFSKEREGHSPHLGLTLANSINFRMKWLDQFEEAETKDGSFFVAAGKVVKTSMMYQTTRSFRIGRGPGLRVLEMPYIGKKFSLLVILPDRPDGLPELEKALTIDHLSQWISSLQPKEVAVGLPKFSISVQNQLGDALRTMGLTLPFGEFADFSGFYAQLKGYSVSEVVHIASIDMNEQGTDAAAVTYLTVSGDDMDSQEVFYADHPFLYIIRDNHYGNLIFMGALKDPGRDHNE